MSPETTVLFVVDAHTGHVHATLELARRLAALGARICYCGPPAAGDLVRAHGHEFLPQPAFDLRDPAVRRVGPARYLRRRWNARSHLDNLARAARHDVAALVTAVRPDLAVFDPFLLVVYPLFWAEGVPVAALSTKPPLRADRATPPYTSRLVPRPTRWGLVRLRSAWLGQWCRYWVYRSRAGTRGAWRGWSVRRVMRALAREVDFPWHAEWVTRPLPFDVHFRGVPEFALMGREFEPPAGPPPAAVVYAGPCVDLDRWEGAVDWAWLAPGDRLIYCSLGTVTAQLDATAARLLRRVAAAFAGRPGWAVLLTVPDARLAASLDAVAPNVRAVTWAPQLESLRRAAVAVTHGGHNTVKECLLLGVPMVVYPRRVDQFGNSARVVLHGVGQRGRPWRDGARAIRRKVEAVADDERIRANLEVFRLALTRAVDTDKAVARLLNMAGVADRCGAS